jgi:hypothetical protein
VDERAQQKQNQKNKRNAESNKIEKKGKKKSTREHNKTNGVLPTIKGYVLRQKCKRISL